VDVILIVTHTDTPKDQRAVEWPTETLPVPADLHVFTLAEWEEMKQQSTRFARVLRTETVWVYSED
jgi:hypothetical protein